MKITVVGLGYVGSTLAVLLSRRHDVTALDAKRERVEAINEGRSPIGDSLMEEILREEGVRLKATADPGEAFGEAAYIVIATNTELNPQTGVLNTASIRTVLGEIHQCCGGRENKPVIVIKSTVPTGFTESLKREYPGYSFLFCPEFLREKTAMEDVLNPSRLIIGREEEGQETARQLGEALLACINKKDVPLLYTKTAEAEAIKLFSNSYLALRVAFFNELDSFARTKGLDTARMIEGVCLDPRIGNWYNSPGPGFGGHCLPKDTRQLVADFGELPELLIRAALEANELRKAFVEERSDT